MLPPLFVKQKWRCKIVRSTPCREVKWWETATRPTPKFISSLQPSWWSMIIFRWGGHWPGKQPSSSPSPGPRALWASQGWLAHSLAAPLSDSPDSLPSWSSLDPTQTTPTRCPSPPERPQLWMATRSVLAGLTHHFFICLDFHPLSLIQLPNSKQEGLVSSHGVRKHAITHLFLCPKGQLSSAGHPPAQTGPVTFLGPLSGQMLVRFISSSPNQHLPLLVIFNFCFIYF